MNRTGDLKMKRMRVWDLPTRVFHGLLIITLPALFITAYLGGSAMLWHIRLAYSLMALLLFRVLWGFVGGYWSRWARLWESAWQARTSTLGHSRSGWASILLFWGLILTQLATGLMADDQISTSGPFAAWVGEARSRLATHYHAHWGPWALETWLGLHLLAVFYYDQFGHQGLVGAMCGGDKTVPDACTSPVSQDDSRHRVAALGLWVLCAISVACAAFYWGVF
jgi:cytochrome b